MNTLIAKPVSALMLTVVTILLSFLGLPSSSAAAQTTRRGVEVEQSMNTAQERRFALVIGNSRYQSSPLPNPANDAREMTATLQQLGFEVSSLIDADQRTIKVAVRSFGDQLTQGGVGLFYYAGHAMQIKGRNYLVPVNASIHREADVEIECVELDAILAQMERNNATNIVVLDACRDNPFARSWRSASQGLAQMSAPVGTFIAYATAPGSAATDGDGKNGLYTEELLKAIREPGLSIEEVFKRVRVQVRARSKGQQTPWDSSSLEGDFFFAHGGPKARIADNPPAGNSFASNISAENKPAPPVSTQGLAITPNTVLAGASSVRGLDNLERNYNSHLYDDVIRDAQPLLAQAPNDPSLNRLLGLSYFEKGQYQQGAQHLQQALLSAVPITLRVQRHRLLLLDERLEAGTLTISQAGLELHVGNETYKIKLNAATEIVMERGGLAAVPRLRIKAQVQEGGGKAKDKLFNLYSLAAQVVRVPKDNTTQGQVQCNNGDCEAWANEVVRMINSLPR